MLLLNRTTLRTSVLLITPALVFIGLVQLYPFISGLYFSFTDSSLLVQGDFVGLKNYISTVMMDDFFHSLRFTVIFSIANVIGSYFIGLAFALVLNNNSIPWKNVIRVGLLIPWIIPSVVSTTSWKWMISSQTSLINLLITSLGFNPILFLSDPIWAVISVSIVKIWRSFPYMFVTLFSVLQSINESMYEAAEIDGANGWQKFRYITFPHMQSITIVSVILMTIWSFNDFDTLWLMTQGGPVNATESLILLAYRYTFSRNNLALGATIAVVVMILLMSMATIMLRVENKERST